MKRKIPWAPVGYLLLCLVVICVCWIGYADQMLVPRFTFGPLRRATLKDPVWNFSDGSADFLLCNTGTVPTTVASLTVNDVEAKFYPSGTALQEGEEIPITVHYPFQPNHTYMFVLFEEDGTQHGSPPFTAG